MPNLLFFGKPFEASRPASARLPRQAASLEHHAPAVSAAAAAIQSRTDVAPAGANPLSGASLVPMLVGGLVLIVLAMCAALALA